MMVSYRGLRLVTAFTKNLPKTAIVVST